jgi:ribosomal protein S18 acetylase RimI-like enzyme
MGGERRAEVEAFLEAMDREHDPPISSMPGGIAGTVSLCLERGGMFAWEDEAIRAFCGYTLGEPSADFSNKDIAYVYFIVIAPEYRRRVDVVGSCFRAFARYLPPLGAVELRFKVVLENAYALRLYQKFALPLRDELNAQGVPSRLFTARLEDIAERFRHR